MYDEKYKYLGVLKGRFYSALAEPQGDPDSNCNPNLTLTLN